MLSVEFEIRLERQCGPDLLDTGCQTRTFEFDMLKQETIVDAQINLPMNMEKAQTGIQKT